ncbi:SusD/RagB family nutrient-binding outer membrane lipoprotein [Rufibacter latericius]|uniref:SusD/RagB family nutrient-binding outer membrane lipoprotein n=1 Tax=Rufibacter latericius TaxID=2487040 RepID=A0A3M9MK16_9BACT|nr:SusD/RagB family nutrient-binding outer membrane lipoprotein [Rufibacter latericius]RNI25891.1 SusD/RagB family nutrient-binding outer membrane lipoprotein [Rufibacter latericius]
MKKIFLYTIASLFLATSCVNDLDDDYNLDPKRGTDVPPTTLVSNAQFNLTNVITTPDYNTNVFRYYVQHWAAAQYPDESQYNINTREINRFFWTILYRDVLSDLREAKNLISANDLLAPDLKASQLACIEVLEVYAWSVLVNTYGDIPYSQALDINNVQPVYDDDVEIYDDLFTRLDAAINSLSQNQDNNGLGNADLFYGGDLEMWLKFANSLKLRMGITIADVNETKARTVVEAAAPNVFTSSDEDARLVYTPNVPTANPVYDELRQRDDNVAADTFIDVLVDLEDPRLDEFFRPAPEGENEGKYVGGVYGDLNNYVDVAQPSDLVREPDAPGILLSYTEVEFLLAEAALRGFNVPGTAEQHYTAAITSSIVNDWGGTQAEATAYLQQPEVMLNTSNWKQSIGMQKWIALYNQPVEGWKEWRRLDYPQLEAPELAQSEIPLRFPYPATEQNLNNANYAAAAAAIGGDVVTTKVFWDVQ